MEIIAFWALVFVIYAYFTITTKQERRDWYWQAVTLLLIGGAIGQCVEWWQSFTR